MTDNQQGYKTLNAPNQPLLSPHYVGAELAGGDRGACLLQGQQASPTSGLQKANALTANSASGYAVTMMKASPPLVISFQNVDTVAISIYALPGVLPFVPENDPCRHFPDQIGTLANSAPFVLAAGASLTLTASRTGWTTS